MSAIKLYQCDVCNKQLDKDDLYRFKRKEQVYDEIFKSDETINFDICKKCYKKIVKQIRRESD